MAAGDMMLEGESVLATNAFMIVVYCVHRTMLRSNTSLIVSFPAILLRTIQLLRTIVLNL